MPHEFQGADFFGEQINARAIVAILTGLAFGSLFWTALFLTIAG